MRIFKFGGASVKDANGVRNTLKVLQHEGVKNTLIVVSAMGKMTNAFEDVVDAYFYSTAVLNEKIEIVRNYHIKIASDLFPIQHSIFKEIELLFGQLSGFMIQNTSKDYSFIYDQIVCYGELLSTKIVSAFLIEQKINNEWLDIRTVIKTDNNYRKATVNWEETKQHCEQLFLKDKLYITQGFISASTDNKTTTLGREGSDYTAGILAYCLDAKSVTIWKDVEGVLNADPRVFKNTVLLQEISYQEAIEMAFYGASVIHPKTLKPLENKKIPLYVRSFENLENAGTKVSHKIDLYPKAPCFIVKKNQILVSISANDFSFMVEENISDIFKLLHDYKLKVNLIQNSAISFSVCIEDNFNTFNAFYKELKPTFKLRYNTGVTLYTVRHFNQKSISDIEKKGLVLLKQISRETVQFVI